MTPGWIRSLIALIRPVLPPDFCGQIEVNVFLGGIRNVNVRQSHRPAEPTEPAQASATREVV